MKQTAVEWLGLYIKGITTLNCDDIIEQAKAMEKEQIQNAYDTGEYDYGCNGDSEQYYNKIFKK